MSAFLVNNNHIDVLVSFFTSPVTGDGLWVKINDSYDYLKPENAEFIAKQLHDENVRSLVSRYGEKHGFGDANYEFNYRPSVKHTYEIAEIAGAIDCLEYQSCESEDYYTTEAYDTLSRMRKELLRKVQTEVLGQDTVWEIGEVKTSSVKVLG